MSQISLSNTWKMDAKCKAEQSEKKVACELKISETRIPSRSFLKKYEEVARVVVFGQMWELGKQTELLLLWGLVNTMLAQCGAGSKRVRETWALDMLSWGNLAELLNLP